MGAEEAALVARARMGGKEGLCSPISDARGLKGSSVTSIYGRLWRCRTRGLPPSLLRSSPEEDIGVNGGTRSNLCHVGISPFIRPSPGLQRPRNIAAMANPSAGEAVKGLGQKRFGDPDRISSRSGGRSYDASSGAGCSNHKSSELGMYNALPHMAQGK